MKKYILGAVLSLGILASPLFASAAGLTSSQISAIIGLLQSFGADQSVINNVQVALNGGTSTSGGSSFCYNFNNDLTVGNSGSDVSALNKALTFSGIDTTSNTASFTENTAGDVVSFQAKYGIRQTGYAGPLTRGKLNVLYGCGNNQPPSQPPQPVPPINPSVSTPVITSLYVKGAGVITPGAMVVVNGYNFDSSSLIELDGNQALGITPVSYSPTSIVFVLPSSWSVGTHSVRVVEMNMSNVASNAVSFTVTAAVSTPTITLFSNKDPNPTTGATLIVWQASSAVNATIDFVCSSSRITFTTDKGNNPICEKGGLWSWNNQAGGNITVSPVGNTEPVSVNFTLTLIDNNGYSTNQKQQINITFPVVAPIIPITVLSPNGGEVWHPGETHRISWTPNAVNNVKIYIYDSNVFGSGSTNYITPNGNAVSGLSGYYDWVIPSLNQLPPFNGFGSANYKIRIDNADTNIVLDSSNAPFSIVSTAVSGLTSAQIQSILSLLTTFNANSTTVANMTTVLNGGTLSTTPPVFSSLTSAQIQSILSLLSSFGANSTIIANVITVLGTSSTPPPTATLSSSSANVAPGGTVFLYFSSTNATSCTAPSGNWLGSSSAIGGSYITNPITSNITFTLQCTGPGGTSPLQSVTVAVGMG